MQYAICCFVFFLSESNTKPTSLRSGRWPNLWFALALAKRPSLPCALKTEDMAVGKERRTTNVAVKLAFRTGWSDSPNQYKSLHLQTLPDSSGKGWWNGESMWQSLSIFEFSLSRFCQPICLVFDVGMSDKISCLYALSASHHSAGCWSSEQVRSGAPMTPEGLKLWRHKETNDIVHCQLHPNLWALGSRFPSCQRQPLDLAEMTLRCWSRRVENVGASFKLILNRLRNMLIDLAAWSESQLQNGISLSASENRWGGSSS